MILCVCLLELLLIDSLLNQAQSNLKSLRRDLQVKKQVFLVYQRQYEDYNITTVKIHVRGVSLLVVMILIQLCLVTLKPGSVWFLNVTALSNYYCFGFLVK